MGTLCHRGGAEKGLPGVSCDIPGAQGGCGSLSVGSVPLCRKKTREREKEAGGAAVGEDRVKTASKKPSEPADFPRLRGTTGHFCRL